MALTQRVGKWWEKKDDEVAHIILVCSYDLGIVHSRCLLIINATVYLCFLAFLLRLSAVGAGRCSSFLRGYLS